MDHNDYPTRRQFLKGVACSGSALGLGLAFSGQAAADEKQALRELDIRIERVLKCEIAYARPRIVAGNSRYRLAGGSRSDLILIAFGSNGKIGVGACRSSAK